MKLRNASVVLVLLFSCAATGYSIYSDVQRQELARCTAEWHEFFYDALIKRSAASVEVANSQDDLVRAADGAKTPEEYKLARKKYLDAREAMKAAQLKNPYPEPPSHKCK